LITLLAPKENDLVISLGDMNGVLACVAIKMHRKFIHITGSSAQDIEAWDNTAKLRIKAVLSGLDTGEIEKDDPMRESYDIPKGKVDILCVSRKELKNDKTTGAVFLTETVGENISDFYAGLLGAYKDSNLSNEYLGLFGKHVIVLDEEEILDTGLLSYLSTKYSNESITVVAERMEISPDTPTPKNVSVIHAPFDFLGR
jgi:hypothetical protein